ncbi:hypothetical protein MNBD_UNCLBAC01-1997 [hydrothermal vent metagenome]|uniref:DNA repair protein RecO n=1 Tax=hydrothermal vent metagenome TaxID=652676 RepID=A0A3B1D8P2_9ZZZZ
MILKTEGIILKTFDLRETSRIAFVFSKEYGKIKGVLKGIRKDPRKFGSSLDRFSVNDIVYYQYRRSDLHLISQCDMKQFFPDIRLDYKRSMAAGYVLELVDKIMQVEQKNEAVYQLMMDYLNSLEAENDIDKLVYIFQIKILLLSGFRPHIDACVKCGKEVSGRARFSLKEGGLLCCDCPTAGSDLTSISQGTVSSMLYIERNQWVSSLRLGLTQIARRELKYILNNFLVYHLERKIHTAKYLQAT